MHQYHLHKGQPKCAMKVDLTLTYDLVEWDFLLAILQLMNFSPRFCGWIRECATTPHFSVKINGQLHGFFRGGRGLRQGDLLSPYLFVMIMQVLQGVWLAGMLNLLNSSFIGDVSNPRR